jgi:CRP/FNR family transcriptional regulator
MKNFEGVEPSPELRKLIIENSVFKYYAAGDTILNENAYIKAIPIVATGAIKVIRTDEEGREILLYYIKPGESCIMSFLGAMHNDTSNIRAEAEEESEIYFLPVDKMTKFLQEKPDMLEFLFKLYHKRFEELLEVVNAIAFKKVDERLWLLLNKKADLAQSNLIHTSHEQLANELATARVVVSRLLKQLEDQGKVKLGRSKLELLERD